MLARLEKAKVERRVRELRAMRDEDRRLEWNLLRAQEARRRNGARYACHLAVMNG